MGYSSDIQRSCHNLSILALRNMETLKSHVLSGWNLPFANRRQERTPVIATDDAAVHASESTNHEDEGSV